MKVAKKHLEVFYLVLKDTKLKLADARIRDAFMKPLGVEADQFMADRTKIYETFCLKGEDGKPDIKDGKYHFPPEKLDEINAELKTLAEEEVEFVVPEKLKEKEIIQNTEYSPKVGESLIIDELISKM